ncbi:TolC family protein [Saccharicrinis aurantiacus]|uniref:TolC family protein n=1 Tax=Saccharicrinis aurantiacus TaxID=1849719 RepID=UPI00249132E8|nr:TolC family protein [Saccharicrinis aurantiacus]
MQKIVCVVLLLCAFQFTKAQTKQPITMQQAEHLFLEQNLELVAEKYNIKMAEAERIQARLWPNPEVGIEWALWDYEDKKWFRNDYYAQRVFEVSQLIELGGKRKKRTAVADIDIEISGLDFYEAIRNLKTELRSLYADTYYLNQRKNRMEQGMNQLSDLLQGYTKLYQAGNFSKVELVRLRSLLSSLKKEVLTIDHELIEANSSLRILLNAPSNVEFELSLDQSEANVKFSESLKLMELMQMGLEHRSDYQVEVALSRMASAEISLSKSEAVPDLDLGVMYDRRGAEQWDYVGLTLGFDLPVFNRNQGDILKAKISKEQAEVNIQKAKNQVESEILEAYSKLQKTELVCEDIESSHLSDLDEMIDGAIKGFQKRNLSIIEFIDYFEAYNESVEDYFDMKIQLFNDVEMINYTVGMDYSSKLN